MLTRLLRSSAAMKRTLSFFPGSAACIDVERLRRATKNERRSMFTPSEFAACGLAGAAHQAASGELRLQPRNHQFEKLPRPSCQRVDAFGFVRARQQWRGDVLAAQRHVEPGKGDGIQQLVMVDLPEAG